MSEKSKIMKKTIEKLLAEKGVECKFTFSKSKNVKPGHFQYIVCQVGDDFNKSNLFLLDPASPLNKLKDLTHIGMVDTKTVIADMMLHGLVSFNSIICLRPLESGRKSFANLFNSDINKIKSDIDKMTKNSYDDRYLTFYRSEFSSDKNLYVSSKDSVICVLNQLELSDCLATLSSKAIKSKGKIFYDCRNNDRVQGIIFEDVKINALRYRVKYKPELIGRSVIQVPKDHLFEDVEIPEKIKLSFKAIRVNIHDMYNVVSENDPSVKERRKK